MSIDVAIAVFAPSIAQRVWNWILAIVLLGIFAAGIWAVVELLVLPRHRESRSSPLQPRGTPKRKDRDRAA
jgi:xanthine/uracil permease